ncbi:Dehydrogenase reductase SDR member 1 [Parelaphostrongylus tenuis]|uniref:Dehydrogenase reductase SDR member 1 n=1 Tax=Parelaphostrongylus tenuis TaxID=148309 RepID=A0AAD5N5C6_PARTN|nr:Dehydrogenase reductase SDR member 1 [Parelaphostrongylus tenuis]
MMVKRRSGLIVNMSSAAGLQYTFNVPYGVGKAAIDRMSADMAIELQPYGVSVVSLWPGMVRTELSELFRDENKLEKMVQQSKYQLDKTFEQSESAEFVGKAVVALAGDRNIQEKSGKVLMTYDLANEYNFKDIDGGLPIDIRRVSTALEYFGFNQIATIVPTFLRIPLWGMHFASYKFPYKIWFLSNKVDSYEKKTDEWTLEVLEPTFVSKAWASTDCLKKNWEGDLITENFF